MHRRRHTRSLAPGILVGPALPAVMAVDLVPGEKPGDPGEPLPGGGLLAAAGALSVWAPAEETAAPEPPAHRAGALLTPGGVLVAGAVRLDDREGLRRRLAGDAGPSQRQGDGNEAPWTADLRLAAAAFERWGEDAPEHLQGDFALVAWLPGGAAAGDGATMGAAGDRLGAAGGTGDAAGGTFITARDRWGVLPLFLRPWSPPAGGGPGGPPRLLLSTSHRALAALPPRLSEPDPATIGDFLLFGETVDPRATGLRGLQALPPGHLLRVRPQRGTRAGTDGPRERRYFDLAGQAEPSGLSLDAAAEAVREALDAAVRDRTREVAHPAHRGGRAGRAHGAGRGASVLASGGLDGSVVAASLAAAGRLAGTLTHTHRDLVGDDSGDWARRVADHLRVPAHLLPADDLLPWSAGAAAARLTASPVHEPFFQKMADLARLAGEPSPVTGPAVILTGEGGDDLCYATAEDVLAWLAAAPGQATAALLATALRRRRLPRIGLRSALLRRWGLADVWGLPPAWRPTYPAWLDPDFEAQHGLRQRWREVMAAADVSAGDLRGAGPRRRATTLTGLLHPRAEALHRWYDVPAALAGVEIRHPLLDHRVVGALLSLPPFPHAWRKEVLRRSAAGRLPEAVLRRPKTLLPAEPLGVHLRRLADPLSGLPPGHRDALAPFVKLQSWSESFVNPPDLRVWAETRPLSLAHWLAPGSP